jgi:cytochrome c-type biogenesis protein CcmH
MRTLVRLAFATAAAASIPSVVAAQRDSLQPTEGRVVSPAPDSALEAMTTALASELRCPVCQGNSIQDSPSELAQQMRDVIRDQLRSGKSPDDVKAYFVGKYGEWILLSPKAEGLNLIVYLVPFAVVLVGGVVVWRTVRRWTTAAPAGPSDGIQPGP